MSKKILIFIPILLLSVIALIVVFIMLVPTDISANAYACDANSSVPESPTLLINGEEYTDVITLSAGESVRFSVLYKGLRYTPAISADNSVAAFTINGGSLTINNRSKLGELFVTLDCTFCDGTDYSDVVLIIVSAGSEEFITVTESGAGTFVSLAENVEYVIANATADNGESVEVCLRDGDDLNAIFAFAPHKSSGATLEYNSFAFLSTDNTGTETLTEEQNGFYGVQVESVSTSNLTGEGTIFNPYLIYSASDFLLIGNYDGEYVYFQQESNITLSSSFTQIHFYGIYRGTGKTIYVTNLTNQYSAMFRQNYGTIRDINIVVQNLTITKTGYVGVVCTQNRGIIANVDVNKDLSYAYSTWEQNCSSSLSQNGTMSFPTDIHFQSAALAGGIAGTNLSGGQIHQCNNVIRADIGIFFGGIVYSNMGSITECSARSYVQNFSLSVLTKCGGMIGMNSGTVDMDNVTGNIEFCFVFVEPSTTGSAVSPAVGGFIGANNSTNIYNNNASQRTYRIRYYSETGHSIAYYPTLTMEHVSSYIGDNQA